MNIDEIMRAAERLKGHTRITPLLHSNALDQIAGRRVLIKPECLQHTGSFKFRGAWAALSAMSAAQRKAGVIAYSSGNHAQGIARAAQLLDAPAVIVMPKDAPKIKIENTKNLGAEVVLYDRLSEDRDAIGTKIAKERGLTLVRPFDEPMVIAGQGTVGLEIAAQVANIGIQQADVLVCCGGGGLSSGIALALADQAPTMQVRPVEPQGFDDVTRSLTAGQIKRNTHVGGSICDAIVTPQPGDVTFPIMQKHCGAGIVVPDYDCLRAMAQAFLHLKLVCEPGGAIALAAALYHTNQSKSETLICVISGGNVDPAMFARALETLKTEEKTQS